MTREKLEEAAESLRDAAEAADDDGARERLRTQAEKFDALAEAERGPDHGKLAHHEHILTEIAGDEPEAAERIETALESVHAYRETVEGV